MSNLAKTCRFFRILRLMRVQKLRRLFVIVQDRYAYGCGACSQGAKSRVTGNSPGNSTQRI